MAALSMLHNDRGFTMTMAALSMAHRGLRPWLLLSVVPRGLSGWLSSEGGCLIGDWQITRGVGQEKEEKLSDSRGNTEDLVRRLLCEWLHVFAVLRLGVLCQHGGVV